MKEIGLMNFPELIVMLTYEDITVENAHEIFDNCKHTQAKFWGFKEYGLPKDQMRSLFSYMKACGKTTFLEVVAYTEEEGLEGARLAKECGCDILMGTCFFDSINSFCQANNLKYMPFVGQVTERPSILNGSLESMLDQAEAYLSKGVYGFDLLGYRYTGNPAQLNYDFVRQVDAPVCLAGSINSIERLDQVKRASPWAFTIGSAFFDNQFGGSFEQQIDLVYDYIKNK